MPTIDPDSRTSWYCNALWQRLHTIVKAKSQGVFNITPYSWQIEVILHMALMNIPCGSVKRAPLLLVRPTGGGISLVRDVFSLLNAGVCLTTLPLLALGADQYRRFLKNQTILADPLLPSISMRSEQDMNSREPL
jgi:hypothetical protein